MNTILDRLWAEAEPNFYGTKEDFTKKYDGWFIVTYNDSFVAFTRGPEFHFHSFKAGCSLPIKVINQFLQNLIDLNGFAQTRTPLEDERQHRFNRLIGFKEIGRDEFDVIYRLESISRGVK